jgi:leucyl-tRNA synthetase
VAMSKSKGNVVGAIEMADKYGADTGRLYTLFAAPPEKDLEWSEESIEGAWRFLNRVYRLVEKAVASGEWRVASEASGIVPTAPGSESPSAKREGSEEKAAVERNHSEGAEKTGALGTANPAKIETGEAKRGDEQGKDALATARHSPLATRHFSVAGQNYNDAEKALLRKAHQTLRRVSQDFETRWHFNSSIAQIMELTNAIYAAESCVSLEVRKEALEILILMLAPITPHLSEELWEMLGHDAGLWTVSWPAFNAELAKDEEVEIVAQVLGKVRGHVKVAAGASQDQVVALAKADPGVGAHLAAKTIVKIIFVKDKLLNFVVR